MSSKKKTTVRISRKDLLRICKESYRMSQQITELQVKCNELASALSASKEQLRICNTITDDVR